MKLNPIKTVSKVFDDSSPVDISEPCDSAIAVLSEAQLDQWLMNFDSIVNSDDASEYCAYWTSTNVFVIDNQRLVVVSDSGGELCVGEFAMFCEELGIEYQNVIDSMDCTGIEVNEIYTGEMEDNIRLLRLVHRIFN